MIIVDYNLGFFSGVFYDLYVNFTENSLVCVDFITKNVVLCCKLKYLSRLQVEIYDVLVSISFQVLSFLFFFIYLFDAVHRV